MRPAPAGTITLTPSDQPSGVAWTRWSLDGGASSTARRWPSRSPTGTHELSYRSADLAGNVEQTRSVTFQVRPKVVTRLSGDDRYKTAAAIARGGWDPSGYGTWPGVTHAIVVCGEVGKESDAVSAVGLSGVYDAPILLTRTWSMPGATYVALKEMARANPGLMLHIVGGTRSVSSDIRTELSFISGVGGVDRLGGADRYRDQREGGPPGHLGRRHRRCTRCSCLLRREDGCLLRRAGGRSCILRSAHAHAGREDVERATVYQGGAQQPHARG